MQRSDAEELEKCLYTTSKSDDALFSCVVAIDVKHAVTFCHGPHSKLQKNDVVTIYNVVDQRRSFKCRVLALSDPHDILVFTLESDEFPSVPRGFDTMYRGQQYMQLSIGQDRTPTWKHGVILDRNVGYYIGSSHGRKEDSGSGIFSTSGFFLGTSVVKKDFCFSDFTNLSLSEVADHYPDTNIICADSILGISGIIGPGFWPPGKMPKCDV